MELIAIDKYKLNKFTKLCAKALDTHEYSLRGFDTENKILTIYMAKKILELDLNTLCEYYRIHPNQLKNGFYGINIALCLDNSLKNRINILKNRWLKILNNE